MATIKLIRGDDVDIAVSLKSNGEPFDLSQVSRIDLHAKAQGKIAVKLSSTDGSISIVENNIILHFAHHVTAGAKWTRALYDLQLINTGKVQTVLRGTIELEHDVTENGHE